MKKSKSKQQVSSEKADAKKMTTSNIASIPVIHEKAKISKRVVASGTVRVAKEVHEEEVLVEVPVVHDEMEVKRVTINQYVDTPPPALRYEGDTMVIPVLQEVVVTEKRLLLVEELRVSKRKIKTNVQEKVTLRKEEVTVKRVSHMPDAQATETPQ